MGRPKELTKQWLMDHGVIDITTNGRVIMEGGYDLSSVITFKKSRWGGYKAATFTLYDKDTYEKRKEKLGPNCGGGIACVVLARAIWAWYHDVCPANMDVDHIDGNSLNNCLDNLQLITRKENLAKRKGYRNQYEKSYRG